MATLNRADIPSNINTYERLAMWAMQCLQSLANGAELIAIEGEGDVPLAQVSITKTADNRDRAVMLAYLPINYSELNSPNQKTWMAAQDISAAQPHTNLLSN